jgi:hypothetical protein
LLIVDEESLVDPDLFFVDETSTAWSLLREAGFRAKRLSPQNCSATCLR